ncbi:MAG: hypothetical protein KF716_20120 [Anaerolineae bacterium]|nr:hypothetical protein [Anaerolineae bacterium]
MLVAMMTRASFYLPAPLLQRLQLISKRKQQSASDYLRTLLERDLSREEQSELNTQYDAWEKVKAIVIDPVPEASSIINTVLYAEKSVWQGSEEDRGKT